ETATCFVLVLQHCLVLEQNVRESENRHQRVVEIVSDAGRHLSEGTQTLLLNHLLLSGFELSERFLELTIYFTQIFLCFLPARDILRRSRNDLIDRFRKFFCQK